MDVAAWLRGLGLEQYAQTVRNQAAEIRRLKAEGLSNAEIASRLNVHRSNVGRVLHGEAA